MLRMAGHTDQGRKRDNNEDRFGVLVEDGVAILADGMGGRLHGEVASTMAVDLLSEAVRSAWPASIVRLPEKERHLVAMDWVDARVRDVNRTVYAMATASERYKGMGTTLLMLMEVGSSLVRCHVGDSRIYRLRAGTLTQITRDHSWVQAQLDQGAMTEEEAARSAHQNVITRAIGSGRDVKPEVALEAPAEGDSYVLCSDGLTDMVSDADITKLLLAGGSPDDRAHRLVEAANAAGGRDNITVVIADWHA